MAPLKRALLAIAAAFPLLAAASSLRVVQFGGLKAVIEAKDGIEHIVIRDRHGSLQTETYCDPESGTYDQIVALGNALVSASKRNDPSALAALMSYPLRVNDSVRSAGRSVVNTRYIRSAQQLFREYRSVMTPQVIELLKDDEPRDAFCRNGMSWVAGGVMWATTDRQGRLRVAVINL